jgi:zinc transporter ZupT
MAVGVENHYNDITGILVAIISHKFFSAFALGVSLVKAGIPSRRTIQLAASFAASTPSGIVIGILMTQALVC